MDTISFSVRVDSNIKKQSEAMYGNLNIAIHVNGFLIDVRLENLC